MVCRNRLYENFLQYLGVLQHSGLYVATGLYIGRQDPRCALQSLYGRLEVLRA